MGVLWGIRGGHEQIYDEDLRYGTDARGVVGRRGGARAPGCVRCAQLTFLSFKVDLYMHVDPKIYDPRIQMRQVFCLQVSAFFCAAFISQAHVRVP